MLKKTIALVLLVVMAVTFTACGGNKVDTSNLDLSEFRADGKYIISSEYIELGLFHPASKDEDGEFRTMKEAAKFTNVYAKPTLSKSNSSFGQAFNLMLASGDIPDLVLHYDDAQVSKYGADGAFVALDEYFNIMPNFKKLLDKYPDLKDMITYSDGHIYYAPQCNESFVASGWMIRQDWLDKLGLKMPTNVDEYYNVLKAFKTQDPNGNGKADEIPYFGSLNPLFGFWGAYPSWYVDDDGNVKYGPAEPEYKVAIKNIAQWVKEGLLDVTVVADGQSNANVRERLLSENIGGSTHEWFGSTLKFNDKLAERIPGFNIVSMLPPTGIEYEQAAITDCYGIAVSAQSEHLEEAIKFIDFWFSDAGLILWNYGIEGEHYDMVDGKPQFKPESKTDPDWQTLHRNAKAGGFCGFNLAEVDEQWLSDSAIKARADYADPSKVTYAKLMPPIDMYLSEDDYETYTKIETNVSTYVSEMRAKWILGTEDVDATYDKYLSEIKKFDLQKSIDLQQAAFDKRK